MKRVRIILAALLLSWPLSAVAQGEPESPQTLTVHYHRFDNKASSYKLWAWTPGSKGRAISNTGKDDWGAIFKLPIGDAQSQCLLFRKGRGKRTQWDQPTRIWRAADGLELWIREGDANIHKQAVSGAFVSKAYADSARGLYVNFYGGSLTATQLELVNRQSQEIIAIQDVASASPRKNGYKRQSSEVCFIYDPEQMGGGLDGHKGIYLLGSFNKWQKAMGKRAWKLSWNDTEKWWELRLPANKVPLWSSFKFKQKGGGWAPSGANLVLRGRQGQRVDCQQSLDITQVYELRKKGEARGAVVIPRGLLHDALSQQSSSAKLGAHCSPEQTTFTLFAPTAQSVELRLYKQAQDKTGATHAMKRSEDGCWSLTMSGDLHGRYYVYCVDAPGTNPLREVIDPYSRCNSAHDGRGLVLDLKRTDPEGFRDHERPDFRGVTKDASPNSWQDAVIYECHIRDLTIAKNSGVKAKGLYKGFVERNTKGPGSVKTGLDHFLELGVTHIQIMPFQDFDNDERSDRYNWGYMPVHFNSPDGWFSRQKHDQSRVREAKSMVHELHKVGLRAILDVVYNHTSGAASFDKIVPYYYYRVRRFSDDPYWNGSGCGNEFRSESAMGRKFILDSLEYWAREYKMDGFRFDLMGLIDRETMVQAAQMLRGIDSSLMIYGEPWTGGDTPIRKTEKGSQQGAGFSVFNDHFRDAIKGSNNDGQFGFVQRPNGQLAGKIKNGMEGAVNRQAGGFALNPAETINYVACHDNKTLFDKLNEDKQASAKTKARWQRLANAFVLLSQGIPFLHAGQDFHRSKIGEHNSYNSPDRINQVDWSLKSKNRATFEFTRGLIKLRKKHPVFRLDSAQDILGQRMKYLSAGEHMIAFELNGQGLQGETWKTVLVIFNLNSKSQTHALPAGQWSVVVRDSWAGIRPLKTVSAQLQCPEHSVTVLVKGS